MPYVSRTELELLLFQKFFFPGLYLRQNAPKLNLHASKELGCEGKKHRLIVLQGKV